jgi:hypothetical protein
MKGSGGGYGFDTITAIGKALEDAARGADVTTIKKALTDLSYYLGNMDIVYE